MPVFGPFHASATSGLPAFDRCGAPRHFGADGETRTRTPSRHGLLRTAWLPLHHVRFEMVPSARLELARDDPQDSHSCSATNYDTRAFDGGRRRSRSEHTSVCQQFSKLRRDPARFTFHSSWSSQIDLNDPHRCTKPGPRDLGVESRPSRLISFLES